MKKKHMRFEDEPLPEGDDWGDWGGELIMAMGFTEGGAPYGVSADDFRESNEMRFREKGWAIAKRALYRAEQDRLGEDARIEVGWVKKIGDGLYRDVFLAEVDSSHVSPRLVALIPRYDAPDDLGERVQREPALLKRLAALDLPISTPRWAMAVVESERQVLVREFLRGTPLDMKAGRQNRVKPWQVVAEVASTIHTIDVSEVRELIPGHATRRAHAIACVEEIADIQGDPVTDDVLGWINDHLPPEVYKQLRGLLGRVEKAVG